MKKLFLASYFSGAASLFAEFTENTCAGKKVVFIATASLSEKVTFYVDADKKALAKLGLLIDELEISTASRKEITSKITSADYVFVEAGNTFFLLQELKRTGADKLIRQHINKGKLYIGSSAGAMVVSKNIEYVKHMDNPAAAKDLHDDFAALAIVDFCVVPHFTNFPFQKAAQKIVDLYSDKLDLRPISNNQAVIVVGRKAKTVTAKNRKKK
ncbi:alpha-aspartyl dipeptidase peptidase E [Candidatus Termititenax aidoneus]|uniref:Alpha-aspartyl dipeptidase peptidase E n=1 Tax=Termititenax aidoneus TaxID=2218524 RepID=A0A388TAV0_TERA1|nr:alpha-aspartyl dipeptidase peptidase E [Candidatus Termititenax aidoneus]